MHGACSVYASALAHEMCAADDVLIEAVQTAALLHDIGKLAIPDRLLHKPGPLTREEYEQVKQHADDRRGNARRDRLSPARSR